MQLLVVGALFFWAIGAQAKAKAPKDLPPSEKYGELFAQVQMSALYADSKQFADAVPRGAPEKILAAWKSERSTPGFSLQSFVHGHFDSEPVLSVPLPPAGQNLCRHIQDLWKVLSRPIKTPAEGSSLLSLPYPAIVPGGRFREMYYWDSYFSLLGVSVAGRADVVDDMVRNFAYLLNTYGHIPNGTRSYYLSRSQPPFFYEIVALTSPDDPAAGFARYLSELRKEHAFWMEGEARAQPGVPYRRLVVLASGERLNRYWDERAVPRDEAYREDVAVARASTRPADEVFRDIRAAAESGWDFSSRWLADGKTLTTIQTTRIIPVDLNSLLFGLENAIRLGCERTGDTACVAEFLRRATARHAAIDRYLWQEGEGVFGDYDWRMSRATGRLSAATLYPLYVGLAQPAQAVRVAQTVKKELLKPGGLATTTVSTGQQWDLPNGWAPLQWIAVRGLRAYGEVALAQSIAGRWLASVKRVYDASGKLVEKYDIEDLGRSGGGGEYPLQDGFGWTNGVAAQLMTLYPDVEPRCVAEFKGPARVSMMRAGLAAHEEEPSQRPRRQ